MIEITGDMFNPKTWENKSGEFSRITADALCFTTNGYIGADGKAVMGRGSAHQIANIFPEIKLILGSYLLEFGNHVHLFPFKFDKMHLVSFPVKPDYVFPKKDRSNIVSHMRQGVTDSKRFPGWVSIANVDLIKQSCKELVKITNNHKWTKVVLPKPGCGAGGLNWDIVGNEICNLLDNRFFIISL